MKRYSWLVALFLMAGCGDARKEVAEEKPLAILEEEFGRLPDGEKVTRYTLRNGDSEVSILDYGGIVTAIKVPDRNGTPGDVVLGFDNLDGYLGTHPYFGALIGRYGNRIGGGRFRLDGKEYKLAKNNGPNALHGGTKGFDKVLWKAERLPGDNPAIRLTYISKDGEEGYPGTLTATVTYTLEKDNALRIDYKDKTTVANLTNHTYFNLKGSGDILGHEIEILADRYTPVNPTLIPTGVLAPVKGTPFDFTTRKAIGKEIDAKNPQIKNGGGYDHNFVLNSGGGTLAKAAQVWEPTTGRTMEVLTTEPGVQFYTGNFLDGSLTGKNGQLYAKRSALCLETQHFPDSPNQQKFPSTVLKPGEEYRSTTVYRFGVDQ